MSMQYSGDEMIKEQTNKHRIAFFFLCEKIGRFGGETPCRRCVQ